MSRLNDHGAAVLRGSHSSASKPRSTERTAGDIAKGGLDGNHPTFNSEPLPGVALTLASAKTQLRELLEKTPLLCSEAARLTMIQSALLLAHDRRLSTQEQKAMLAYLGELQQQRIKAYRKMKGGLLSALFPKDAGSGKVQVTVRQHFGQAASRPH